MGCAEEQRTEAVAKRVDRCLRSGFEQDATFVAASIVADMHLSDELETARAEVTQAAFRMLNSVVEPAVMAGVANPLPVGAGAVVLETTGRVSGKKRRVPLLASRVCGKLVVSTVRSDSQWLKNIEAEAEVTVWLYGKRHAATASVDRGALNVVTLNLT